jgi:WD40 repeat protein
MSRDGSVVARAERLGATLHLLDSHTGRERRAIEGPCPIRDVEFAPDGQHVAAVWSDRKARVYEVATGRELGAVGLRPGPFRGLALLPGGRTLLLGNHPSTGEITAYEFGTGAARTLGGHTSTIHAVACSAKGDLVATGDYGGTIIFRHAGDLRPIGPPRRGQNASITGIAFSGAGDLVASAGDDGLILVWDIARPAIRARLLGHIGSIQAVAFSPDASALISGDTRGRFKVWDLSSPDADRPLGRLGGRIRGLAMSRNGRLAVIGRVRGLVWDADLGKAKDLIPPAGPTAEWEGPAPDRPSIDPDIDRFLSAVALSADGALAAIGSTDSRVVVREAATGRVLHTFQGVAPAFYGPPDPQEPLNRAERKRVVGSLAFAPDAGLLAAGYGAPGVMVRDYDQLVRVWSLRDGREVAVLKVVNSVRALHFTEDGQALLVACFGSLMHSFSTSNWKPAGTPVRAEARIQSATVSPDETMIASGLNDGGLAVWERATGRLLGRAQAHTGPVFSVAFTPDGRTLATSRTFERTLVLWEAGTLRELLALPLGTPALGMAFSPKGDALLIAQGDDIRLWPAWPLDRIDAERAAEKD